MTEVGFDRELQTTLLDDLNELSKKDFGQFRRAIGDPLISNDEGYEKVRDELKSRLAAIDGGIGVFIGGGGLLSLLPDLPVDAAVAIDMNPAALEMNKALADLIKESETPDDVKAKLADPETKQRFQILNDYPGDVTTLLWEIGTERKVFKEDHWTDPSRFGQVKASLERTPLVYCTADITDPAVGSSLTRVSNKHKKQITFANLTNVHGWILGEPQHDSMDFLSSWPIAENAPILFSTGIVYDEMPQMRLARGSSAYIQQANQLQI